MRDEKVHVLGAGIVGICTALSLLEKGFAVELIDRNDPASGASYGNAGVISPWSCIPQSMPGLWKQVPKWLLDPDGPLSLRLSYAPRMVPWLWRFLRSGAKDNLAQIAAGMNALNRPNVELYTQHLKGTGHENLLQPSYYVHAFRNTLLPVVTVGGLMIGTLIAYTILTETVFQWPGMGFLFLEAVNRVDTPLIVAYLIVVGFIFVLTNTVVDLIYGLVNPTVNLARMGA